MNRAVVVLLLAGCNPVQRISNNANAIRTEAQALGDHGQVIGDPVVVAGAGRIDGLAAGIHDELPNVTNKIPAWLSTLQWWGIALACVGVAVILWQTNLGAIFRVAIGWLPRAKVRDAEMAAAMLDDDKTENPREYIAARRGADLTFDAAWRKIKKEKP